MSRYYKITKTFTVRPITNGLLKQMAYVERYNNNHKTTKLLTRYHNQRPCRHLAYLQRPIQLPHPIRLGFVERRFVEYLKLGSNSIDIIFNNYLLVF
jgi:hypothetical protein